ncbi:MAG: hypothetical protein KVP17_001458 [Porospora cf. gigantea B]|uniref:uncharacterized protein n=1 Tax=Porospora cf. gigantea B TaxID=2853592 RepID=UPI003571A7B3|nr:MAG: hypothetical protein KVP17_001458 [Porospora cf. gigantea B]
MSRVEALRLSPCSQLLAVARSTGNIEVFNAVTHKVVALLTGSPRLVPRSLHWVPIAEVHEADPVGSLEAYRLLACCLSGDILVWDVYACHPVSLTGANAGSIFGSDMRGNQLALACSDGTVRLYTLDIDHDVELRFERSFQTHGNRLLCVAFTGDHLAAGAVDSTILKFDLRTGLCVDSCTVHRPLSITKEEGKIIKTEDHSAIWSLLWISSDGLLVSGDSMGHVSLWDEKTMTLTGKFTHHEAEVVGLALTTDGSFYTVGIDGRVSAIVKVENEWTLASWRFPCSGQIRSISVGFCKGQNVLVLGDSEGGVRQLRSALPFQKALRGFQDISHVPPPEFVAAKESSLILNVSEQSLDLWNLRQMSESGPNSLHVSAEDLRQWSALALPSVVPEKVATIQLKPDELLGIPTQSFNLCEADINPNGSLVAAGTLGGLRVFHVDREDMQLSDILCVGSPAVRVAWLSNTELSVVFLRKQFYRVTLTFNSDKSCQVASEVPVDRQDLFTR